MGSRDIFNGHRRFGRRAFLRGTAVAALAGVAAPALIGRAKADGVVLNFATYGGVLNDYMTRLFAVPFEKETGIRVNFGGNASLALAKLQTTSGTSAQWDLINLTGAEYLAAVADNIIVPYDYSIIDASNITPEYKGTHGIKFALYLFGMGYDKRKLPEDKAPNSWPEFWDTQRFPGKRSLYSNPSDGSIIEIALLADGVPIDKLYPLDVERALKSLEKLGRQNIIWHTTNQEPIQQMTSGAVSLATCFDGRVVLANRAGAELGFQAAGSAVSGNPYCVIRTSAHQKAAFQFLNFIFNATDADAEYMDLTNYAVPNMRALPLTKPATRALLPTAPGLKDKVFIKDDVWWKDNLVKVTQRFKEWQLAG
jgi:putative spermidine/putrescine transport system substrate-binding protein